MRGKLYGIGVGPGDPELLTIKAIKTIKDCHVIAVPSAQNNDRAAFYVVEEYLENKPLISCLFSMEKDEEKRKELRIKVADDICSLLEEGKSVGFITLGDPSIYSTYMYVHKIALKRGFETEIIPGITSFTAVAALLNDSLCEGDEILHIIPASHHEDIEELLELQGNKIIMKSGKSLNKVLEILDKKGLSHKTKIVERCGMEGQRVFNNIEEFEKAEGVGYFTIAIVKE